MKLNIKAFEKILNDLAADQVMIVDGHKVTVKQIKDYLAKKKG